MVSVPQQLQILFDTLLVLQVSHCHEGHSSSADEGEEVHLQRMLNNGVQNESSVYGTYCVCMECRVSQG